MNDFLLRHAIDNVWCNPAQDRQHVFKLARLTSKYGVQGSITLLYERLPLPTTHDRWHVFQIGKVLPKRMGLPGRLRQWMSLSELAEENFLYTELYVENGFQLPRFETYAWLTPSRNLVIAVKAQPLICDVSVDTMYLRLYTNAYFQSARSVNNRQLLIRGRHIQTNQQLLVFQAESRDLVEQWGGYPYYFINGRFANDISIATAGPGDVVEFVLDRSIKRVVELPVAELPTFTSTLDTGHKYILHYDDPDVNTIEFFDDVDVYLTRPTQAGRWLGTSYHRNEARWLRMLTHKDYSLPVNRLSFFVQAHVENPRWREDPSRYPRDNWSSPNELTVRLYIRHSGYKRPLVADSHRIQELYRLSSDRIVRAMTGIDSTVPLWRAETLEVSPYVQFMSASPDKVYPLTYGLPSVSSQEKAEAMDWVGQVYGYHAAAKILSNTPTRVSSSTGMAIAPLAFEHRYNSTVFEYDEQGKLLEWHVHHRGGDYRPKNADTFKVEALVGRGGCAMGDRFGKEPVTVPYGYTARLYVTGYRRGQPTIDWKDITELDNRSDYGYWDGDVWNWTLASNQYGLVRIDDAFVCTELTLRKLAGQLRFNVTSDETHDGQVAHQTMQVPAGQLDVNLNGRWLVEDLDYTVRWPEVVIHNLEYLAEGDQQKVLYRVYGFCRPDLSRSPANEWGFVEYGVLSNNNQYDIHKNRILQVVIDGHYHEPSDVVFDEDRSAMTISSERNGAPYIIKTPPQVLRDVFMDDKVARMQDNERDQMVSDYMTLHFPATVRDNPNFIEHPYTLVSVFSNRLIHDFLNGYLELPGMYGEYSDQDIMEWLAPYAWLANYDLCNTDYDTIHLRVYPHWFAEPVGLDIYQYQLYTRALGLFLNNPPDHSVFVYMNS